MIRLLAGPALAFLLLAGGPGTVRAAGTPDAAAERVRQEAALSELRGKVAALQSELAEGSSEQADAADALRDSERAISEARRELGELAARHAGLRQSLVAQQAELATLVQAEANHRQALSRLLAAQSRRRIQEPLRLLLQGGGPYEVRRQLVYLRALNATRLDALAGAQARAARAAALRAETAVQLAELERIAQARRAQQSVLERERQARQRTLARIGTQLEARRRQLATAQADESRLTLLVARLAVLLDAQAHAAPRDPRGTTGEAPAAATAEGSGEVAAALARFRGLLKMPAVGELVARFGVPRNGSGPAWKGWFIRAPAGTPVHAVAAGKVVFADWLRGFGNLVIVDHGDGFMSLYGNNDALLEKVGVAIAAGQSVAQAGASGGAAESGVYFELRHNGIAFDPKDWFGAH